MEDELFYQMIGRIGDLRLILNQMKKASSSCTVTFKPFFNSVDTLLVYLLQAENSLRSARDLEVVRPF